METKFEAELIYNIQEYRVKFDLGNPVEISIGVYHENQTELTRDEIIAEALGYAHEVKLPLDESSIYEIETVTKE